MDCLSGFRYGMIMCVWGSLTMCKFQEDFFFSFIVRVCLKFEMFRSLLVQFFTKLPQNVYFAVANHATHKKPFVFLLVFHYPSPP